PLYFEVKGETNESLYCRNSQQRCFLPAGEEGVWNWRQPRAGASRRRLRRAVWGDDAACRPQRMREDNAAIGNRWPSQRQRWRNLRPWPKHRCAVGDRKRAVPEKEPWVRFPTVQSATRPYGGGKRRCAVARRGRTPQA